MSGLKKYSDILLNLPKECNVNWCKGLWISPYSNWNIKYPAIKCPACDEAFHLLCTDIGTEDVFNLLGNYVTLWRCLGCVDVHSPDSQILTGKIAEVHQRQIMLLLKENAGNGCDCSTTDTSLIEQDLKEIKEKMQKMLELKEVSKEVKVKK